MAANQFRNDVLIEVVQMLLLPHEKGVVGGQLVDDQRDLRLVPLFQQMVDEFGKALVAQLAHGGRKPPGDELLFLRQVDAVGGFDEIHHPAEIRVGDRHGAEGHARTCLIKRLVFVLVQFDHVPRHSFRKSCPQSSTSMVPEPSGMVHIPDTKRCIFWAGMGRMSSSAISTIWSTASTRIPIWVLS